MWTFVIIVAVGLLILVHRCTEKRAFYEIPGPQYTTLHYRWSNRKKTDVEFELRQKKVHLSDTIGKVIKKSTVFHHFNFNDSADNLRAWLGTAPGIKTHTADQIMAEAERDIPNNLGLSVVLNRARR